MVPKSEYLPIPGGELLRETNDILTNTYTQVVVNRGSPYEVCVWVQQAGSVLTWDFDIIKGECEFVIYYSEKKISSKTPLSGHSSTAAGAVSSAPTTTATTPGPLDRVVDTVTSELSNLLSPSTIPHFHAIECEPEFRVGTELTIIGNPLDFKETDSMQGTTYCDKGGTYILQWRHPGEFVAAVPTEASSKKESSTIGEGLSSHAPSTTHQQQQKTSTSGPTHKCRLMVYYELLNSKDFKGSVASLESCRSSFNSLVAAAISTDITAAASSSSPPLHNSELKLKQEQQNKKDSNASIEEDYSTATEKTPKS
uniref:GOLD domain-containing protein n=1 Tax=Meloidogyne javanica TaxID=6303 RepID=A0A915N9X5_MELJA